MRDTAATIASLTAILAVVLGVALVIAGGGIAWLVTVMLRPLRRVADTAERVARRPLARAFREDLPEIERIYLEELMATPDANEGIAAFMERRAPKFGGEG